jgi:hypothetical protein
MTQASNYLEGKFYDHVLRATVFTPPATVFMALFSSTASLANLEQGTLTGEVAVGGYARTAITFGAAAARALSNSGQVSYPTVSGANYPDPVRFYAFMDANTAGNVLAYGQFDSDLTFVIGNTPQFAAGLMQVNYAAGSSVSDYLANKLLDLAFRNVAYTVPTVRVGLFGTTASVAALKAGTLTGEIAGNAYARQTVTFGAPTDGVGSNSADVVFGPATPGAWGVVRYFALLDAASSGNVLSAAQLTSDLTVNIGNPPRFVAGQLQKSFA